MRNHFFSTSAIAHFGHLPGVLDATSGCMGQVYIIAPGIVAGMVAGAGAMEPIESLLPLQPENASSNATPRDEINI
jgi:hypothetical protein